MRKIGPKPVATFVVLVSCEAVVACVTTAFLVGDWVPENFRGITAVCAAVVLFYLFAIIVFRFIQRIAPLSVGEIAEASPAEFRAFLYTLHYLLLFNTLIFNPTIPVPLMRVILQMLGAQMGDNAYSSGIVMDPQFVEIGDDSIIGNGAMIVPHVIEGRTLGFYPVKIGKRVTVGARAVIMADVEIGDDATIAVQAVVLKGSRIPPGEVWGGTPARRLKAAVAEVEAGT